MMDAAKTLPEIFAASRESKSGSFVLPMRVKIHTVSRHTPIESHNENIVADVNIDGAPGLLWPNKDLVPLGVEHSSLSKDVESAARNMGYTISPDSIPDPIPEEVIFIRSDQYLFVKQGVCRPS
jgi:hypothetical protein